MRDLLHDTRYAVRMLLKAPGYLAACLVTLALGIGANTAIFSFIDGILLTPLPYAEADRIVRVLERPPRNERSVVSTLNFLDWQEDNDVFEFMAAQTGWTVTLTGVSEPVLLRGGQVSARFFDIFGIRAARGRTFLPDEDQLGNERVVVLTHGLCQPVRCGPVHRGPAGPTSVAVRGTLRYRGTSCFQSQRL